MKHFIFIAAHRKPTGGRQNQCHGSTMLSRLMLLITLLIGMGSSAWGQTYDSGTVIFSQTGNGGSTIASDLFDGYPDNSKVVFEIIATNLGEREGWGIGTIANDADRENSPVSISVSGGEAKKEYILSDLKAEAIFTDNGLFFNCWGFSASDGKSECTVTSRSVTIYRPTYTITWDPTQVPSGCDAWFEINSTQYRTTQANIPHGTAVVYRATDGTTNNWVINGWRKGAGNEGWLDFGSTYTVSSISSDINIYPEFQNTHVYIAAAEAGGSAIVYANGDGGKTNISGNKYKSWEMNSGVVFEATPSSGYRFLKWNDNSTQNPRDVSEHADGTTYSYTAVFEADASPNYDHYVSTFNFNFLDADVECAEKSATNQTSRTVHSNNTACSHVESNNCLVNVKASWSGLDSNTPKSADKQAGEVYWKFGSAASFVKIKPYYVDGGGNEIPSEFMPGDQLTIKLVSTSDGYAGVNIHDNTREPLRDNTSVANTPTTIVYTLTADDIDDDGGVTIYRDKGVGYSCRYHSIEVESYRYTINVASNNNTYGTAEISVDGGVNWGTTAKIGPETEVMFKATKISSSPAVMFDKWHEDGDTEVYDNQWSTTFTKSGFTENLDLVAEFVEGHTIAVEVRDESDNLLVGAATVSMYLSGHPEWGRNNGDYIKPNEDIVLNISPDVSYEFLGWYESSTQKSTARNYEYGRVNNNTTIVAKLRLKGSLAWDFTTGMPSSSSHIYKDGGNSVSNNEWTLTEVSGKSYNYFYLNDNTYTHACNSDGTELSKFEGLLFKGNVGLRTDASIYLNGNTTFNEESITNGVMKVPVKRGQKVVINAYNGSSGPRDINFNGASPNKYNLARYADEDIELIATEDGYITVDMGNNSLRIDNITITSNLEQAEHFTDCNNGGVVYASNGATGYSNPIPDDVILPTGSTITWSTNNTSVVDIDPATGELSIIADLPVGGVTVTATIDSPAPFPQKVISYTLQTGALHFDTPLVNVELDGNSVGTHWQDVHDGPLGSCTSTKPTGQVKWRTETTAKSASVSEDNNGLGNWVVTITGKGTTTVYAQCGAVVASYQIVTSGDSFNDVSPIYKFTHDGEEYYFQSEDLGSGWTWSIDKDEIYGAIASEKTNININASTGRITGLKSYAQNKGGAIVVKAVKDLKTLHYTLTIPYKKNVYHDLEGGDTNNNPWNFYDEDNGGNSPIRTFGPLVEGMNPGGANSVKDESETTVTEWSDGNKTRFEIPKAADLSDVNVKDNPDASLENNLKRRKWWMDKQTEARDAGYIGNKSDYGNHDLLEFKYWNYTFKTMTWDNSNPKKITYVNEPLFSYVGAVNGDNARIVPQTAGLIFNCAVGKFGVNDHKGGTESSEREQDRAILIKGDNPATGSPSSFTIPGVKVGDYIVLHWYRHSDNAGDQFMVKNGVDMDDNVIPANVIHRFTGSFYQNNAYVGRTIIKAGSAGSYDNGDGVTVTDVTISVANGNWTEIYEVQVTDVYKSELNIGYANIQQLTGTEKDGDWTVDRKTTGAWKSNATQTEFLNTWGGDFYYDTNKYLRLEDGPLSISRRDDAPNTYAESDIYTMAPSKSSKTNLPDTENLIAVPTMCTDLTGLNPIIYLNGVPVDTHSWNGWSPDFELENCPGSNVGYLSKQLTTHVGARVGYSTLAITNFTGRGTLKVTMRVNSGWHKDKDHPEEEHYCFEKNEAYIAVGDYKVQTYPYTWDFRQYNMEGGKVPMADRTINHFASSGDERYGKWDVNGYDYKLQTFRSVTPTFYYTGGTRDNKTNHNKFLFANGSRLVYDDTTNGTGTGDVNQVREADGLRFTLKQTHNVSYTKEVTNTYPHFEGMNNAITLNANYAASRAAGTYSPGYLTVTDGIITVPEVDKGMYVFVKTTEKPLTVTGAVDINDVENMYSEVDDHIGGSNTSATTIYMKNTDILDGVYVYKVTAEGKTDVDITPALGAKVYAIGVTKEFKLMPNAAGWMTDSRHLNIDYNNSYLFTKHDLHSYIANGTMTVDKETAIGAIQIIEAPVIPSSAETGSKPRGLLLKNMSNINGTMSERRMIPLFVPACNIPNNNIDGNRLLGSMSSEIFIEASTDDTYRYGLTNMYYDYNPSTGDHGSDHVVPDYSFIIARNDGMLRKNSAYLEVTGGDFTSGVPAKQMYMFYELDEDADEIIGVPVSDVDTDKPMSIYTINGMKLSSLPTKAGIYIINGKKVLVKEK